MMVWLRRIAEFIGWCGLSVLVVLFVAWLDDLYTDNIGRKFRGGG